MRIKLVDIRSRPMPGMWHKTIPGALWSEGDGVYVLHNDPHHAGCDARNKHGYRYSYVYWVSHSDVEFDLTRTTFVPNRGVKKLSGPHIDLDFRKVKRFTL